MEHRVEAKVIDPCHLKLEEPTQIPPGSKVLITIEQAEGVSEEQGWYFLAAQALELAYDEDEPEYSLELVKEYNPDYRS